MPNKVFEKETKLIFKEWGSGQPVLLLHGYGGSASQWVEHATELSKNYRVIVPQLNHLFGSLKSLSFTHQVEYLLKFIEDLKLDIKTLHLVGVSYGAALVWALAIVRPELIDRVILINPMPPAPVRQFRNRWLRFLLQAKVGISATAIFLSSPFGQSFLREMINIFRIEKLLGLKKRQKVIGRKLLFVASLIQRFTWILSRENWDRWTDCWTISSEKSLIIYDPEDPLFISGTYEKLIEEFDIKNTVVLEQAGHMAITTQTMNTIYAISQFLSTSEKDLSNKWTG